MSLKLTSRKLHHMYSFVIQKMTWNNCLGSISLEYRTAVTENNDFGTIVVILSSWSANCLKVIENNSNWLKPTKSNYHQVKVDETSPSE